MKIWTKAKLQDALENASSEEERIKIKEDYDAFKTWKREVDRRQNADPEKRQRKLEASRKWKETHEEQNREKKQEYARNHLKEHAEAQARYRAKKKAAKLA